MAGAASASDRKDVAKTLESVSQNAGAVGQLDLAGFRMGKTRLVSKKKKQSALKKVVLEERADRVIERSGAVFTSGARVAAAHGATTAAQSDPRGSAHGTFASGLSADVPEFIPQGWGTLLAGLGASAAVPSVADSGLAGNAAEAAEADIPGDAARAEAGASTASAATAEALPVAPKAAQGSATLEAAMFIPTWCQGPPGETGAASAPCTAEPTAEAAELPVAEAIERMRALQEGERGRGGGAPAAERKQKDPSAKQRGADIEVRHYVHQLLSEELDEKVKVMLAELVRFQERAKADALKFQKLKRFCVGMREALRSVARGKCKCIIAAPNLEECSAEGGLDDTMEDLIETCREADVPVVFALSRNRIGKAMGKNMRLSLVCILSAEGAHQEFKQVLKLTDDLRRQWVIQQMANFTSEDAEEARRRAEQKAARDVERRERKAQEAVERKAEEDRLRLEAKAAKEANKAQKAKERQADIDKRRALKAEKDKAEAETEAAEKETRDAQERKAEDDRRKKMDAERSLAAERAKLLAAERAAEEKRREEEEAAKKAAAGDDGADSDSDASSDVPLGFSSALF